MGKSDPNLPELTSPIQSPFRAFGLAMQEMFPPPPPKPRYITWTANAIVGLLVVVAILALFTTALLLVTLCVHLVGGLV